MGNKPKDKDKAEGRSQRAARVTEKGLHTYLVPETPDIVHLVAERETDIVHRVHEDGTQTEYEERVYAKTLEELVPAVRKAVLEALQACGRLYGIEFGETYIENPNQDTKQQRGKSAGDEDIRCRPHALVDGVRVVEAEAEKEHDSPREEDAGDLVPVVVAVHDEPSDPYANQGVRHGGDGGEDAFGVERYAAEVVDMVVAQHEKVHNGLHVGFVEFKTVGHTLQDTIDDEQPERHPQAVAGFARQHEQGAEDCDKSQTREDTEKTQVFNRIVPNCVGESVVGRDLTHEHAVPTERPADEDNQQTAREEFGECLEVEFVVELPIRDVHRDSHTEYEKGKDEVGRGTAVPCRMSQRGIDVRPRAWVVDKNHPCDGDTTQNVQREETLLWLCSRVGLGHNIVVC